MSDVSIDLRLNQITDCHPQCFRCILKIKVNFFELKLEQPYIVQNSFKTCCEQPFMMGNQSMCSFEFTGVQP